MAGGSESLPIVDDESCDFLCKMKKKRTLAILCLIQIHRKLDVSQCLRGAVGSSWTGKCAGAQGRWEATKVANLPSIVTDYVVESVKLKRSR